MDNQHRKITGYRELDAADIALMNRIKALEAEVEDVVRSVRTHIDMQGSEEDRWRHAFAEPCRWLAIGRTDIQQGFMALTRAVAQPTPREE